MLTLLATGLIALQDDWVLHDLAGVATVRMPAFFRGIRPTRMSFVGSSTSVANPIGKRVIFRSFAGPTPMLNCKHVTRWFNGFRLNPR